MATVGVSVGMGSAGEPIYVLRVGDRKVLFGSAEATRLAEDWPGRIGNEAARHDASEEPFEFPLGDEMVRLSADESRQFAALPVQLHRLLEVGRNMQALHAASERET